VHVCACVCAAYLAHIACRSSAASNTFSVTTDAWSRVKTSSITLLVTVKASHYAEHTV